MQVSGLERSGTGCQEKSWRGISSGPETCSHVPFLDTSLTFCCCCLNESRDFQVAEFCLLLESVFCFLFALTKSLRSLQPCSLCVCFFLNLSLYILPIFHPYGERQQLTVWRWDTLCVCPRHAENSKPCL